MKSFAELFKKYRLRAEFETFAAFGNALSEKGYHYEDSIFSHWQKGTRIPTNRHLMLKIIEIFLERNVIQTAEEASELLSSTKLGYLTEEERKDLLFNNFSQSLQNTSIFEQLNRLIFFFFLILGIALFFMYAFIDFQNTFLFFVFSTNLLISLYLYLQTKRKTSLILFLNLFAFGCSAWCLAMIFYRASSPELAIVAAKFLYLAPLITPVTFLLFSLFFPNGKIRKRLVILLVGCMLLMAVMTLLKNGIIVDVSASYTGEKIIKFGWVYYSLYIFYYPLFFGLGYFVLFKKFFKFHGNQKMQILCILVGMMASSIPAMVTNLILPTIGIFALNWVGQLFTIFWILGIAIAITRYRLLDLKPFHKFKLY